jgi:chaperone required for assembly of F1-ATPase
MRRFYSSVTVVEREGGFGIALDDRPLRTPATLDLMLPTRALAEAVAEEWRAQDEHIRPHGMPLTRLASTAIDRVAPDRTPVVEELASYAETDLLCYRAGEQPELAARQAEAWQPLLDWAAERFAARLEITHEIAPLSQPAEAVEALRAAVEALEPMVLAGLHAATAAAGSVVIGLALAEGRLDADRAFEVSVVDETFQIEQWGEDSEAMARRRAVLEDLRAAAWFMALCRD